MGSNTDNPDVWKNFTPKANPPMVKKTAIRVAPTDMAELDNLLQMDRMALKTLLQRVLQAGWGYGSLTGKELLEMALKSKNEAYEALKLTALTLAVNAADWREFNALATFWAEREKGKPSQAIDVTGKIGIVEIVLEAAKQRKMQPVGDNPLLPPVDNTQVIDNE